MSNQTRNAVAAAAIEVLEDRQLLSGVVNISPGYQDATSAIQNALNSAGGGGTVNLAAGNYNVSSQLTLPSGVTLQGNGNATLTYTGALGNLLYSPWYSVGTKLNGVTLNGGGWQVCPGGSNITVSNNTFENNGFNNTYYGNGLYVPDVETNLLVTGNTFTNITGSMCINFYDLISSQIVNNTFTNDGQAIHGMWYNGGVNCLVSNNTLSGMLRFGIELQGNPTNLTVSYNTVGNWQQRDSHFALSITTGPGNGINILNNTLLGTGITNPNTNYTAIEAMGNNLTIANNFAAGWGWAQLVGYTDHWVTENNTWGVVDANYAIEAGGINPAVNTGNVNVSSTDFSGHASGSAPTTTTSPTTTSAPTSTTTNSSSTLPSGWSDSDIGSTGARGSASYANGVYTVAGAGSQIWGSSDAFNYAYQTVSSSSSITAEVTGAQVQNSNSEAGVMVRSSLSSSASNVYLYLKGDGNICMNNRSSNSGATAYVSGRTGKAPVWLRLVTSGNAVNGYYSINGSTWNLIGTVSTSLPTTPYAGLVVCSAESGALDTATFANVSVTD